MPKIDIKDLTIEDIQKMANSILTGLLKNHLREHRALHLYEERINISLMIKQLPPNMYIASFPWGNQYALWAPIHSSWIDLLHREGIYYNNKYTPEGIVLKRIKVG